MNTWAVLSVLFLSTADILEAREWSSEDGDMYALVKASNYHFQELKRNLEALQHYNKGTGGEPSLKRGLDENLMPSLLLFCDSLAHPHKYQHLKFPDSTPSRGRNVSDDLENPTPMSDSASSELPAQNNLSSKSITSEAVDIVVPRPYTKRGLYSRPYPVRVELSKRNTTITMTFLVVAQAPFKVVRQTTLNGPASEPVQMKLVTPTSGKATEVSISFPEYQCPLYYRENIQFQAMGGDLGEKVGLRIFACPPLENADSSSTNSSHGHVISENIVLPEYNILGHQNEIIVNEGQNASIDLEFDFNMTIVLVRSRLYDWSTQKVFDATFMIRTHYNGTLLISLRKGENVLSIQELNESTHPLPSRRQGSGDTERLFHKRVRVILNSESRQLSGFLVIGEHRLHYETSEPLIVPHKTLTKIIPVRNPEHAELLPRGVFIFEKKTEFFCRPGDAACFLTCQVLGRDITSMTIVKKEDATSRLWQFPKTKFIIYGIRAFAAVHLGPRQDDMDGDYECEAMDSQGRSDGLTLHLTVTGFPGVDMNKTRIDDMRNGSVMVTCAGNGQAPLETAVYVDEWNADDRLENNATAIWTTTDSPNEISTSMIVPTTSLQWPKSWVYCEIKNSLGSRSEPLNLFDHVEEYYPE